jgi:hypothetical protein
MNMTVETLLPDYLKDPELKLWLVSSAYFINPKIVKKKIKTKGTVISFYRTILY